MSKSKWQPVGGCSENPGVWDSGNGACIYVDVRSDGMVRRRCRYYAAGRGPDWTCYWPAGSSTGCWPAKNEQSYRSAAAAAMAGRGEED